MSVSGQAEKFHAGEDLQPGLPSLFAAHREKVPRDAASGGLNLDGAARRGLSCAP
jgi:hypothetical protein